MLNLTDTVNSRCRAIGNMPNDLMRKYYEQRTTEGSSRIMVTVDSASDMIMITFSYPPRLGAFCVSNPSL